MTYHAKRLVAAVFLTSFWLATAPAGAVQFFLEELGAPIAWPTTGDIITGTPQGGNPDIFGVFEDGERAGQTPFTLTQTFQVDTEFDLNSLFIAYRNDITSFNQQLQIFPVDDVFSLSIPTTIPSTDFILNETFDALSTNNQRQVAQLVLDSPLTLTPNTATPDAGYALRFVGNDPGRFRWHRTDGSFNNIFPGGNAYERGNALQGGERDFGLVLSDAPAPPPLMDAFSVQSGLLSQASTWDTNAAPEVGFVYNVVNGDTVSVNSGSFGGSGVVVTSGSTLDLNTSGVDFRTLEIQPGANLDTSSISGTIVLGDINADRLMTLDLQEDVTFSPTPGGSVNLFATISGTGDINVQSNGSTSDLGLVAAEDLEGVVRFNGNGRRVLIVERQGFNILEMNSTGDNILLYQPQVQTSSGAVIFNQPGQILHLAPNQRRQTVDRLVANAAVTVDLTTSPTGDSLRYRVDDELSGAADVDVVGTSSAPLSVDPNQFEIGFLGSPVTTNDYSGTLTSSNFVTIELYRSLPNARFVVGTNSRIQAGFDEPVAMESISLGEVEVSSGGTLVVGFAQGDAHDPHTLRLTSSGTRGGDLTTSGGSTVVMQINGTGEGEFDSIVANGDVSLAGQLDLLINPDATGGNGLVYMPTLGDTFDLITIGPGSTEGDYTGDGVVDRDDYDAWVAAAGTTGVDLAADGNGDGIVNTADYAVWRDNLGDEGLVTGSLTGSLTLNLVDPNGVLALAGLAIELNTTATSLQAVVVSAPLVTIPEPSALGLCLLAVNFLPRPRKR